MEYITVINAVALISTNHLKLLNRFALNAHRPLMKLPASSMVMMQAAGSPVFFLRVACSMLKTISIVCD